MTRAHIHACTYTHAHTRVHIHARTYTRAYTRTHIHARTYMRTNTRTIIIDRHRSIYKISHSFTFFPNVKNSLNDIDIECVHEIVMMC